MYFLNVLLTAVALLSTSALALPGPQVLSVAPALPLAQRSVPDDGEAIAVLAKRMDPHDRHHGFIAAHTAAATAYDRAHATHTLAAQRNRDAATAHMDALSRHSAAAAHAQGPQAEHHQAMMAHHQAHAAAHLERAAGHYRDAAADHVRAERHRQAVANARADGVPADPHATQLGHRGRAMAEESRHGATISANSALLSKHRAEGSGRQA